MQTQFDTLYARSANGQNFYDLIDLMQSSENIRLAYRNIKKNTGSKTAGFDGQTIEDIKRLPLEAVVSTIQKMFAQYCPQVVDVSLSRRQTGKHVR